MMKPVHFQLFFVLLAMLLALDAWGDYKGQGGTDDGDPLNYLTKRQKEHYEAYAELAKLQKEPSFNRAEALEKTFGDVREWCKDAAPKYKMESMKAGDKAKESQNEKQKKKLLVKSASYAQLYEACLDIVKQFESGEISFVEKALGKYRKLEASARANGFPVMKREWLCYSEYTDVAMKVFAYKNKGKKQKETPAPDRTEEGRGDRKYKNNRRNVRETRKKTN